MVENNITNLIFLKKIQWHLRAGLKDDIPIIRHIDDTVLVRTRHEISQHATAKQLHSVSLVSISDLEETVIRTATTQSR